MENDKVIGYNVIAYLPNGEKINYRCFGFGIVENKMNLYRKPNDISGIINIDQMTHIDMCPIYSTDNNHNEIYKVM